MSVMMVVMDNFLLTTRVPEPPVVLRLAPDAMFDPGALLKYVLRQPKKKYKEIRYVTSHLSRHMAKTKVWSDIDTYTGQQKVGSSLSLCTAMSCR
jgi:hypothetical protein